MAKSLQIHGTSRTNIIAKQHAGILYFFEEASFFLRIYANYHQLLRLFSQGNVFFLKQYHA